MLGFVRQASAFYARSAAWQRCLAAIRTHMFLGFNSCCEPQSQETRGTRLVSDSMPACLQEVTDGKEVTLPSGVRFTDEKIGGGAPTQLGYLVILDYK